MTEEEFKEKTRHTLNKYLIVRKRIQKLLLKTFINEEQERQAAEYIQRLDTLVGGYEEELRLNGVIGYATQLHRWTNKEIKNLLL